MLLPKDFTQQEKAVGSCLSRLGFRFVEQFNILNYTVDFWVPELNMVIEADGKVGHLRKADAKRDAALLESEDPIVQYVVHVTKISTEDIMEELCQVFDKL